MEDAGKKREQNANFLKSIEQSRIKKLGNYSFVGVNDDTVQDIGNQIAKASAQGS
jgi:hypothetical protein